MGRLVVKTVGVLLALVLVVAIGAAVYLKFFFDANQFKPRIAEAVEKATGRRVTLAGDLSITLWPAPHATLKKAQLADLDGFDDSFLAEIDRLQVDVALAPLLHRQVVLEKITADGARLHLKRHSNGQSNWGGLFNEPATAEKPAAEADAAATNRVVVHRIELARSEITLDDRQAKRHLRIGELQLDAGWLRGPEPAPISAAFRLQRLALTKEAAVQREFDVDLSAQALVKPADKRWTLRDATVEFTEKTEPTAETPLDGKLRGEAGFDPGTDELTAKFMLEMLSLNVDGELLARGFTDARQPPQTAAEKPSEDAAVGPTRIEAKLDITKFNARQLIERLGGSLPPMRDASTLTAAEFHLDVSGDEDAIAIKPRGQLDGSKLGGVINVKHALEDRPVIRFDLNIDRLDLDRFRRPRPKGPPAPNASDPLGDLPLVKMRGWKLDMRGQVSVGALILNGDTTRNFKSQLSWNP